MISKNTCVTIDKSFHRKSILFLETAKLDLVIEAIAHIKFLYPQCKTYVLSREKSYKNFKKLKNIDVVLTVCDTKTFCVSKMPPEIIKRLKAIKFEHIYLVSKFNTGNPVYYKKA